MFFDFSAVKKSKESLEKRLFDIRNQTLELQKKVEAIRYAPASRADVKTSVRDWMKGASDGYAKTLFEKATLFAKSPANANAGGLRSLTTLGGAVGTKAAPILQDYQPTQQELGQAVCALLGPSLLDSLMQAFDAMPWPENAVPMADRLRMTTELGEQISKLQQEEAQIVKQAADAGLNLD